MSIGKYIEDGKVVKVRCDNSRSMSIFLHKEITQNMRLTILLGQLQGALDKMHLLDWECTHTRQAFKRWFDLLDDGCLTCSLHDVLSDVTKGYGINFETDPKEGIKESLRYLYGGLSSGDYLEDLED